MSGIVWGFVRVCVIAAGCFALAVLVAQVAMDYSRNYEELAKYERIQELYRRMDRLVEEVEREIAAKRGGRDI